jgi:hypothetical protein
VLRQSTDPRFQGALVASGHKLGAELATNPPDQPALPRQALGEDQRELRGNFEMFGNDLHTAIRDVRDHTVARQ